MLPGIVLEKENYVIVVVLGVMEWLLVVLSFAPKWRGSL